MDEVARLCGAPFKQLLFGRCRGALLQGELGPQPALACVDAEPLGVRQGRVDDGGRAAGVWEHPLLAVDLQVWGKVG